MATVPTNQEILDTLKTQYYAALQSPSPSYSLGEIRVDRTAYLKSLSEQIKQFEELVNADTPVEEITIFTDDML